MENLKIRSKEYEFWSNTGEVLSQDKFSETHVSGGGGGGNHGHSSNISISSSVVTQHEFWLKTDDGKEEPVQLTGHDIPLREGQRITVVYMQDIKSTAGAYPMLLVNHTADRYWHLTNGRKITLLKIPTGIGVTLITLLVVFMVIGAAYTFDAHGKLGTGAAGGAVIWLLSTLLIIYPTLLRTRGNKLGQLINSHLDTIARNILNNK